MDTTEIEVGLGIATWLEEYAAAMGVSLEQLVAHILLQFREQFESGDGEGNGEEEE